MITRRFRAVERFLLPNACIVCHGLVAARTPDALVCAVCRTRLRSVLAGCRRCRQPLPPVGPCRFCAAWGDRLRWVGSGCWLGNEARAIVHQLKYGDCPRLGELAADVIAASVRRPDAGWLIPVPLAPRRRASRGYNQAEAIARALGRRWAMPVAAHALRRRRDAPSQTALTPERRLANVAGAFAADVGRGPPATTCGNPPRLAFLVDDVLTTGATLNAAADALCSAGWPAVAAVTFARTMPFEHAVVGSVT